MKGKTGKRTKKAAVDSTEQAADQAIALRVGWLFEFMPDVRNPERDPLRTWMCFSLLTDPLVRAEIEAHISERWGDGIVQDSWTAREAKKQLVKLTSAIRKSLMQGVDTTTIPGMAPMMTKQDLAEIEKWMTEMVTRLKEEFGADEEQRRESHSLSSGY